MQILVGNIFRGRGSNRRDKVRWGVGYAINGHDLPGLHGPTRHKHGGNIQAEGSIEHAGGDFIAVRDAHHGVGGVGIAHIFDRIGNDLPGREGIQHAAVAHGNTIVDRNGIEFFRHPTSGSDSVSHNVANVFQMHVAGHELGVRVHNGDNGLAEFVFLSAGGAPKSAGPGRITANSGHAGSKRKHKLVFLQSYVGAAGMGVPARIKSECVLSLYRVVACC